MSKFITLSFCAAMIVLTSGCGKVSLDMDGFLPSLGNLFRFGKGAEFVASAQQGETTLHGYVVDSSVGSVYPTLEAPTANGYRVYSSVQGVLLSEAQEKQQ